MGARRVPLVGRQAYDWLNQGEGNVLADFLIYLHGNEPELSELVIVGDFLDNWICPNDELPPSFGEVLAAHPQIIAAMNALLAKGVRLVCVEGNHDMYLAKADLDLVLHPSANLEFYHDFYLNEGIYAVHGHSFDPFNMRVTDGPSNYSGLPLGYFISRIMATQKALTGSSKRPILEVIKSTIVAFFLQQSTGVAVFDAILKEAGLGDNTTFLMPDGGHVSVPEIRGAFSGLLASARIADLEPSVQPLAQNHKAPNGFNDIGLVVCGHTHDALVKALKPHGYVEEDSADLPVYANSGTWAGSDDRYVAPTYIEVEPDADDDKMIYVRRKTWENNAPHQRGEESFALPGGNVIFSSPSPQDDDD